MPKNVDDTKKPEGKPEQKPDKRPDKTYNKKHKKQIIIKSLSGGSSVTTACMGADCSRDSFYEWLKNDKTFAKAVDTAKKSRCVVLEDAMFKTAINGNATMQIFLSCNLMPEKFKSVNHQVLTFSKEIEEGKKVLSEALDDMQKKARKKNGD
jgi:hypothetical protein